MLSHGLTTGGLFLGIGVLYERRHTRRLAEYGGLWKQMPVFAGLYLIIVMGSAGLPALSGFVGEFLSLIGTFNAADTFPSGHAHFLPSPHLLGALATTGVILGAIYLLYMFQKVFFGKLDKARNGKLRDLRPHELIVFIVLAVAIFLGGLFPRPLLHIMEPSVNHFIGEFDHRIEEPDGPPHIYGEPIKAAVEKNLAAAARGARDVADTVAKGATR
jgi:NADH-quinone oxidoreductase subunit M